MHLASAFHSIASDQITSPRTEENEQSWCHKLAIGPPWASQTNQRIPAFSFPLSGGPLQNFDFLLSFVFLAQVHENGMLVGMKNTIELIDDLSSYYDFAINESCFQWDECGVSLGNTVHVCGTLLVLHVFTCPSNFQN